MTAALFDLVLKLWTPQRTYIQCKSCALWFVFAEALLDCTVKVSACGPLRSFLWTDSHVLICFSCVCIHIMFSAKALICSLKCLYCNKKCFYSAGFDLFGRRECSRSEILHMTVCFSPSFSSPVQTWLRWSHLLCSHRNPSANVSLDVCEIVSAQLASNIPAEWTLLC